MNDSGIFRHKRFFFCRNKLRREYSQDKLEVWNGRRTTEREKVRKGGEEQGRKWEVVRGGDDGGKNRCEVYKGRELEGREQVQR